MRNSKTKNEKLEKLCRALQVENKNCREQIVKFKEGEATQSLTPDKAFSKKVSSELDNGDDVPEKPSRDIVGNIDNKIDKEAIAEEKDAKGLEEEAKEDNGTREKEEGVPDNSDKPPTPDNLEVHEVYIITLIMT